MAQTVSQPAVYASGLKHQLTLTFKTLKKLLKTFWWSYPHMFRSTHSTILRGSYAILCAATRLGSADLRLFIVCAVCGCMCLLSVLCMWLVLLSGWDLVTSHTHNTDDKHIQPQTAESVNQRKSAEPNLVAAQSTAYDPLRMVEWVDRNMQGQPHQNKFVSVLNVSVSWCFKVYKCMSWNKQQSGFELYVTDIISHLAGCLAWW